MIYHTNNDPVNIKKIFLRIWTFRDQLESLIREYLEHHKDRIDQIDRAEVKELIREFLDKSVVLYQLHQGGLGMRDDQDIENGHIENTDESSGLSEEEQSLLAQGTGEPDDAMMEMMHAMKDEPKEGEVDSKEDAAPLEEENVESEEKEQDASDQLDMAKAMGGGENVDQSAIDGLFGDGDDSSKPTVSEEEGKKESEDTENKNEETFRFRPRPKITMEKISAGTTSLADININEIYFFSTMPFLHGQLIMIEFILPRNFVMMAEIIDCKDYNLYTRIISDSRPRYRCHASFTFLRKGERTIMREFVQSIQPDIPIQEPKKKEEGEGEDIDDLDDLGL